MKKIWSAPEAIAEQFAANEYVAECGDENRVYNFICDAPGGTLYYYPDSDGNINGEYTGTGSATRLGSYTPCEAEHEASTTDAYYDGYIKNTNIWTGETTYRNVIVWRGANGRNGHATAQLDMKSWETAKS